MKLLDGTLDTAGRRALLLLGEYVVVHHRITKERAIRMITWRQDGWNRNRLCEDWRSGALHNATPESGNMTVEGVPQDESVSCILPFCLSHWLSDDRPGPLVELPVRQRRSRVATLRPTEVAAKAHCMMIARDKPSALERLLTSSHKLDPGQHIARHFYGLAVRLAVARRAARATREYVRQEAATKRWMQAGSPRCLGQPPSKNRRTR